MLLSGALRAIPALVVVLLLLASLPALSGETIGWRTDGTGRYPTAQPPLEWSTTKNVVWRTPMPGYGVSHPVLLGHRLFICSEPCILFCLDKSDGKVLWQKNSSYDELEIAADVRERLKVELAEEAQLAKKRSGIQKELDQLHRSLTKDMTPKEDIEKKLKPFRTQIDELKKESQKLTVAVRYTVPPIHGTAGYSAPTPVTNGKEVYVAFGNGLVACFDLEGNRKWLKLIEHSNAPYAHSCSPVLVGDKVLIHFTDLVALDMKTGDEVWRLQRPTAHGTPLVTRIGDVDVVFTPKGLMIRAQDGKILAEKLGSCGANSPILHDGVVYYVHGQATANRLPASLPEPVKLEMLWRTNVKGGGYGFCSPVVHEGLLYAANDQGILTALDIATGKIVYEERLNHDGTTYPSLSLAGNRLYASGDRGTTVVLEPGREFKVLARNKLEPFRSSLVFEGKRVYIRTEKSLYCIGE
jgi:outer membrane protein assembly factor BamB